MLAGLLFRPIWVGKIGVENPEFFHSIAFSPIQGLSFLFYERLHQLRFSLKHYGMLFQHVLFSFYLPTLPRWVVTLFPFGLAFLRYGESWNIFSEGVSQGPFFSCFILSS